MTAKIFWTKPEKEKVLAKATEYYKSHTLSPFESIKQAQAMVLSTNRQRKLNTHSACYNLTDEVKKRAAQPAIKLPEKVVDPLPEPQFISNTLDELVNAVAQRIASTIKESIHAAVQELEHEFKLKKHDPTYDKSNFHVPRIVIVGLLDAQARMVETEYGNKYDFKFVDASKTVSEKSVVHADAYLIMKNFVTHSIYGIYQKLPNHVLIDGGMATLRAWLNTKGTEL